MLGRDQTRNPVSPEQAAPTGWDVKTGKNIKWKAKLGSVTFGTPVVAGGLVWIGTNHEDDREPGGDLLCFRESDGELLSRISFPAPKGSPSWGIVGITASPLIEEDRLWFITLKSEVICLDISPVRRRTGGARELWKLDMAGTMGVVRRFGIMGGPQMCSIGASYGDFIYVITGNGRRTMNEPPNPLAPALLCLDKNTGRIIWEDNSPGANTILGEWASPLTVTVDGRAQVIAPQGDGWVRSFDAATGEFLWKFDINPKSAKAHERNFLVPPPVFYHGKICISSGGYIEFGEGKGRLVCLDPRRKGDISFELPDGQPNPNSGAIWRLEEFGRAMATPAIHEGLVIAAGYSGIVYCLDAETGKEYWRHDLKAHTLGAPLIVDNKIFLGDQDGEVEILQFSREKKVLNKIANEEPIYASPVFANGVLYVAGDEFLYAITTDSGAALSKGSEPRTADWPQWRGPDRSNASREAGLLNEWPPEGPPLLWSLKGLGLGIHSVSAAGGRLFTIGNIDGNEIAFAIDAVTGQKIWARRLGATIQENALMRWLTQRSPTVDQDRVYFFTANGELFCLSSTTGEMLWQRSYSTEFGSSRPVWGYRDDPIVEGDRLICTPFGTNAFIVALNKYTGQAIWQTRLDSPPRAGHAALVPSDACGVHQYIVFHSRGLSGFAASDGKLLWDYARPNTRIGSTYTPLVKGDFVCSPNGYGGGLVLAKLSNQNGVWNVTQLYDVNKSFDPFQDNTALVGDQIYTCHARGRLSCIDFATGNALWEANIQSNRLALTYADGHLYLRHASGVMTLLQANALGYKGKGTFSIPNHETSAGVTFPVIAAGRLYIRDNDRLHCYNILTNALDHAATTARQVAIILSENELRPDSGTSRVPRTGKDRAPDAVFVPTPHDVVDKMLEIAEVKKETLLVDLGSGDGRILIAAAKKYGCQAVGYEIDKRLVEISREAVLKQNVEPLVRIEHEDIFTQDLSNADVVTAFLYPRLMERLIPQLQKLKPGSRIVSHQFEIPGIKPDKIVLFDSAETGDKHRILLWTAPIKSGEATK